MAFAALGGTKVACMPSFLWRCAGERGVPVKRRADQNLLSRTGFDARAPADMPVKRGERWLQELFPRSLEAPREEVYTKQVILVATRGDKTYHLLSRDFDMARSPAGDVFLFASEGPTLSK